MFEAAGNDGMAEAMDAVQGVMTSVSNIGRGFAEGGVVGGIAAAAGEAIGWVTKAFQASARHKAALEKIMEEVTAQQREYNLLLMEQNLELEKAQTIFGTDTYGKAANAVRVMKDAYAAVVAIFPPKQPVSRVATQIRAAITMLFFIFIFLFPIFFIICIYSARASPLIAASVLPAVSHHRILTLLCLFLPFLKRLRSV